MGEFLLNGKEDAANNFARGHYTVGGGTGSGLGALILERIAVDYRKKSKIGFEIYPAPKMSTCIVEPYNAMLTTHWLLDHTEVSVVLDNEAIYQICQKQLDVDRPSYADLNMLIAKVISSMTASLRFDGELNVDLGEFQTNLVPFPRLHFMTTALAPVINKKKSGHEAQTVREITDHSFQPQNMLVKYEDFDPVEDKYMAISINYRGEIKSKEANSTVQWLKQNNKVAFVEWCPTGFKIGLNDVPAKTLDGEIMTKGKRNVAMIGNHVAVS